MLRIKLEPIVLDWGATGLLLIVFLAYGGKFEFYPKSIKPCLYAAAIMLINPAIKLMKDAGFFGRIQALLMGLPSLTQP
jgi:hypothetical protein